MKLDPVDRGQNHRAPCPAETPLASHEGTNPHPPTRTPSQPFPCDPGAGSTSTSWTAGAWSGTSTRCASGTTAPSARSGTRQPRRLRWSSTAPRCTRTTGSRGREGGGCRAGAGAPDRLPSARRRDRSHTTAALQPWCLVRGLGLLPQHHACRRVPQTLIGAQPLYGCKSRQEEIT